MSSSLELEEDDALGRVGALAEGEALLGAAVPCPPRGVELELPVELLAGDGSIFGVASDAVP